MVTCCQGNRLSKKCTVIAKKNSDGLVLYVLHIEHAQDSFILCSRKSWNRGQTPTTACSHHVTLLVFTEAQHGGMLCGSGMGEAWSKAENKGYILTAARYYHICPHAVQTRSMLHQLITTCRVKAQLLVATPGSRLHPWHPQILTEGWPFLCSWA